jgi:protein-S-isoprenylcysteine O-methyltransferase Ste14
MTAAPVARPFNQRIRIWTLRGLFLALLPLLLMTEPRIDYEIAYDLLEPAGVLLIVFGVLFRFWAILYIGDKKNQTVVQDGPYSICRHPLYLGSTIAIVGFGVLTLSIILTVLIGGLTFIVLYLTARREERYLQTIFGPAYAAYAARVPRLIPQPSLFQTPENITFSASRLRVNLQDALVFLSLFPLIELLDYVKMFDILPRIAIW